MASRYDTFTKTAAPIVILPLESMSVDQMRFEYAYLYGRLSASGSEGGRMTNAIAAKALAEFNAHGGDARMVALKNKLEFVGAFHPWYEQTFRSVSFYDSTIKPLGESVAIVAAGMVVGAAAIYGVTALIGSAATPAAAGAATTTAATPAAAGAATTSTVAASAATTTATAATTGGIVNTTLGTTLSGWMADAAALGVSAQGLQQTFAKPQQAAPVMAQTPNSAAGGITTKQALIGVGGLVLAIVLIRAVI
jgi:hypothetical protein